MRGLSGRCHPSKPLLGLVVRDSIGTARGAGGEHARASPGGKRREPFGTQGRQAPALRTSHFTISPLRTFLACGLDALKGGRSERRPYECRCAIRSGRWHRPRALSVSWFAIPFAPHVAQAGSTPGQARAANGGSELPHSTLHTSQLARCSRSSLAGPSCRTGLLLRWRLVVVLGPTCL